MYINFWVSWDLCLFWMGNLMVNYVKHSTAQTGVAYARFHVTRMKLNYSFSSTENEILNQSFTNWLIDLVEESTAMAHQVAERSLWWHASWKSTLWNLLEIYSLGPGENCSRGSISSGCCMTKLLKRWFQENFWTLSAAALDYTIGNRVLEQLLVVLWEPAE